MPGDRIIDDNLVIDFEDDNHVLCFEDDLGNFTCQINIVRYVAFHMSWVVWLLAL